MRAVFGGCYARRSSYARSRSSDIEEGKLADLLVVEGNPLEDISVLQEEKNLKIIMKNGRMAKNSLQEETR
jgi:hypothetical protein